ncbi:E3 ubiquitin-protein ligase [Aphelenchoides bicaudatus]|nr:E3 ubiquitin-protein ligase [Aphelenchoides bicaudatus]
MQSRSLQYRGISVRFEQGDISTRNDDALAISCDLSLTLSSPLCRSFVNLAGSQLQTLALREVVNHPQLYQYPPTPVAICIPASGQLQTRNVILLPIGHNFGGLVTQLLVEMFNSAIHSNSQSLAFPPIGTGGFGLSNHYELSKAIFDALKAVPNFGTLRTVTLVTANDYWTEQYYHSINDYFVADQQASSNMPQLPQINDPSNGYAFNIPNLHNLPNLPNYAFPNNAQNFLNLLHANVVPNPPNAVPVVNTPPVTNNNQNVAFSSAFKTFDKKTIQEMHRQCLKDKQNEATSSKSSQMEDDRLEVCAVCLNDMLDDIDNYNEDSDTAIVQTVQCLHKFHRFCLTEWFKNKTTCPVCTTPCLDIRGNQPVNGIMSCYDDFQDLPGFPNVGNIRIEYEFPHGVQTNEHPNPGVRYSGTARTCYLPNNQEGRAVRDMLRIAFDRRLVFTVGESLTTGRKNVITWNGIHHKTSRVGGPARFGYPDPTYLQRVKEELALYGINESLLT